MDKKRVLIVDDEASFLLSIKKLLQNFEFEIWTAGSLPEAMALLGEHRFGAVVTDVRLTNAMGREGFEILQHIKQHMPETTVIILTGYGGPGAKETAYRLGANVYLEKPVPAATLRRILEDSPACGIRGNKEDCGTSSFHSTETSGTEQEKS